MALILAGASGARSSSGWSSSLPYVLAQTATGLMFTFVYDGNYGLLKSVFELFGAKARMCWRAPRRRCRRFLFVVVWKYFGFHMMLMIAGLQSLDKNTLEAAAIDAPIAGRSRATLCCRC